MSVLDRILYILNMLALFALALSYLAPYVSPSTFLWPIAFLGLLYPVLVGINILFGLYWLVSFKRHFWSNLFIILIGYGHIQTLVSFQKKENTLESHLSVMSFNVRLFNIYKWIDKKEVKDEIVSFINTKNPNVLCLQEFYAPSELPDIKMSYKHIGLQDEKKQWRMATYSSFPIIEKGTVSIKGERKNNICIYSDIATPKDTIRVYNVHLASNWFRESDYSFMQNPVLEKEEFSKGIRAIGTRLKSSFFKRAEQVRAIKKHMNRSPHAIILCGDFNDTPNSYAYHQLSSGLKDAFVQKGKGFGRTYNGKFPSLRIDYILHSPELNSTQFRTHSTDLSDHFPIQAGIN